MPDVFSPLSVRNVKFANRAVMAPMVCFHLRSEDGVMRGGQLEHYLRRGAQGLGLMILQALPVGAAERAPDRPGIYADAHIPALREIAARCREGGTRVFAQLAYPCAGWKDATERERLARMDTAELRAVGAAFVEAALRCAEAGLDGVELHGAHGYFLNMLASPLTNARQDGYGGDREGRLALAREIITEIRKRTGEDFLISYRLGIGYNEAGDIMTARELAACGADLIHVSFGIPQCPPPRLPEGFCGAPFTFAAGELRKGLAVPVIAVGSVGTLANGTRLIENGCCDFAAYGRPFLADPDFFTQSLRDPSYAPCLNCPDCDWFADGTNCPGRLRRKSG